VSVVEDIEHIDEHRPCHAAYRGKGGPDSIGQVRVVLGITLSFLGIVLRSAPPSR
jgi:hypothetical protein